METKTIHGDLVLKKDTKFDCNLVVEGDIICEGERWNINCRNIDCWDIDCGDIDCRNINCRNIDCRNIDCRNIDCWDIDCGDIILCEKIKVKKKIRAKYVLRDRFNVAQKEWESD